MLQHLDSILNVVKYIYLIFSYIQVVKVLCLQTWWRGGNIARDYNYTGKHGQKSTVDANLSGQHMCLSHCRH